MSLPCVIRLVVHHLDHVPVVRFLSAKYVIAHRAYPTLIERQCSVGVASLREAVLHQQKYFVLRLEVDTWGAHGMSLQFIQFSLQFLW
jgi:hypothetical protein